MEYPGGPEIDASAKEGDPEYVKFPRALLGKGYDFSFSGLKTSVLYYLKKQKESAVKKHLEDIAASFQKAVVDVLTDKSIDAANHLNLNRIAVGGGVSANSALRAELSAKGDSVGIEVVFPPLSLTTDNGAMIAAVGTYYLERGIFSPLSMNVYPNLAIGEVIPQ